MQDTKFFKTKRQFMEYLIGFLPSLNIPYSVSKSKYTIQIGDKVVFSRNIIGMYQTLNELIGGEVFINGRLVGKQGFKATIDTGAAEKALENAKNLPKPEVVKVEKPTPVKAEEVIDAVPEQKEENKEAEEKKDDSSLISLEVEGEKTPDWKWIDSLENNKDDKTSFKNYAQEEFGIELKGNVKLENLVTKFKEELEK